MKISKIRKNLKKSLKNLYGEYKKCLRTNTNAWLCDNYYCFERDTQALLSFYSQIKHNSLGSLVGELYDNCKSITEKGLTVDSEQTAVFLSQEGNSILSYEYAPIVLKTAILIQTGKNASDENAAEKCVKTLKLIDETDFEELCEKYCENEKLLNTDEIYTQMPPEVKSVYRKRIFAISKKKGVKEADTITKLLGNGRHIGFGLFSTPEQKNLGLIFIEEILSLVLATGLAFLLKRPFLTFLFFLPVRQILNCVLSVSQTKKNPPRQLLRLEKDKIPDSAKTLVTVSTLLPNAKGCKEIEKHLVSLYAGNRDENIYFCILADKKEFSSSDKPDDKANINALTRVIERLNLKYGNKFFLFIREREYSKTGRVYTGKNRKMGALCSLVKLICHGENEFETVVGDSSILSEFKYILALDSDTKLSFLTAKKLIMTALHPLNRAVIDRKNKTVKSGYGIFSLRVLNRVLDENGTYFSLLMSGSGGSSAYDELSGERFSDVFGSGIFAGKGLIDIEAYDTVICGRFKDEKILSHDILEGEFMKTLYVSDAEALDSFPKNEHSFLSRLHRWTRGDWQNISFLFFRPSVFRSNEKNPLPFISKYKLFENLRRSITPVFSLLLLLCSVFFDSKTEAVMISVSLLSVTAGELISFFNAILSGGIAMLSRLYYSAAVPDALSKISQAAINLTMLPATAFKNAGAIIKALIRQFITKRKMLEWTTAADSEKNNTFISVLWNNKFNIFCSVFLFVFHSPYTVLCGIIFLMNIFFDSFSQRKIKKDENLLDSLTRERLLSHAAAQWKYYEEYAGENDNYLPADNVQFSPVFRVAHRTSPTNIGLMLVSTLAAGKNEFTSKKEMLERIEKSVSSIEKLEKYKGNLFNWYDTSTLLPLEPRFVSTVDSGNFLCSLTALKEGLKEYKKVSQSVTELIKRIEKIIDETDLTFLYNKKRHLFHIGFDINEGSLSKSYYDLMMSEARMTSYFAVSKRITDKKHWGFLSRLPGKSWRYTGPLSWSGTMFEYFMPNIFLPARKNTFSYEGLRFCLYCQILFGKRKRIPWGVSESAFYGFDADYNYQYKAHGINKLRLSRSALNDTVISPYSSYLALPFSPKKAAANIKRLERLHLFGPYGLYEAADFTKERIDNKEYRIIKSYMAHHIGMSLLSIVNVADNFYIQKLFMSDIDMQAGSSLLDEQIPTFTPLLKNANKYSPSHKDERRERFIKENNSFSVLNPKAQAYSNGEWTLSVCENGVTKSTYRDRCIFRHSEDLLFNPHSVVALLRANGMTKHFCPFMNLENKEKYHCVFKENEAVISYFDKEVKLTQRLSVHKYLPCEKRSFTVQNLSKRRFDGEIIIYFEPCLNDWRAEKNHPAFSHLFVSESFDEKEKILSFSRRDRNIDFQTSLSCGFLKKTDFSFTCSRENALRRPYGIFSLENFDNNYSALRGSPDCCGMFSIPIKLTPKEKKTFTLFFSASKNMKESKGLIIDGRQNGALSSFENANAVLGSYSKDSVLAKEILPALLFKPIISNAVANVIEKNERAVDALWSLGISGDKPIILFAFKNEQDMPFLKGLLKIHNAFLNAFIKNDLVIITDDKLSNLVFSVLKTDGLNTGSIFVVNETKSDSSTVNFLYAYCSFLAENKIETEKKQDSFNPIKICSGQRDEKTDGLTENGYEINSSPVLPWCYIYSNDNFGTLVSDKSPGFTYAGNSFLNKLTGWSNDTRTDLNSEILLVKIGSKYFNPLLNANVLFTNDKAVYKSVCDGIEFETQISVEKEKSIKSIILKATNLTNKKTGFKAVYSVEPVMSYNYGNERLLHFEKCENHITVSNPLNTDYGGKMTVGLDGKADIFLFNKTRLFGGEWQSFSPEANKYTIAAIGKSISFEKEAQIRFFIEYGQKAEKEYLLTENRIIISSPDKNLNALVNTFLPVQIIRGRLQARTGFYQCSGAYGFRDQIQDALSLSILFDKKLKEQILINASAQFTEGDCLHWFHLLPDGRIKGVRTRYSDDRLWLPLAVCEYINTTGDRSVLNEKIPYLKSEELKENETEKYLEIYPSEESGTVFEHCVRAIERSLVFGKNGLPLILGGDWNDGFNSVGRKGNGESVWLGEFLVIVLERFALLCDEKTKEKYKNLANLLREKIDENAFSDGQYIRAFLDDGSPLGSNKNSECKIDSLSQSFAVFCNMPDKEKVRLALESAEKELVDRKNGLIKLFSEGFYSDRRAGYISAYPVGLRENGGQYTHAAVWLAKAFIENGQNDKGYELLSILNPLNKYEDENTAKRYMTEPYFLAGDVYSLKGIEGRGGWTVYTGSAGWYYKTAVENVFGLKKRGNRLYVNPRFPSEWENCSLELCIGKEKYIIEYFKNAHEGLFIDGKKSEYILLDGKNHKIIVNYCGKK